MPSITELLEKSRNELLDLSTRNRLLSIPVSSRSARIIQVQDELSEEVYKLLVEEEKTLSFLPGRGSRGKGGSESLSTVGGMDEEIGLPQPEEEKTPSTGVAKRHVDSRLQTALSPEGLQSRLLDLYRDARTMIEEQGVNILYLALGHLKWFESEDSNTPRYAPLILIPVELSRKSASDRFVLRWTSEDIEENLSLRAKAKKDFNVELPPFPEEETFSPAKYFDAITNAVALSTNWEVIPNAITLGFFSFAKFLMYRDLSPETWPVREQLTNQRFIKGLLLDGFPEIGPLLSDDVNLDQLIPVSRLDHVVDADGSQTVAIEAVRQGRSVVIQGPPGTGKSQSITNIISTAVLDGKKVLFVAEKLAALEVVKRRLVREGLGALCLELHSNKSSKRTVIEEIARTWGLGKPRATDVESLMSQLEQRRGMLNSHVAELHARQQPSDFTPFCVIGHLAILGTRGAQVSEITFSGAEQWTADQYKEFRKLVQELVDRIKQIGLPSQHVWRGVARETVLPMDVEPILKRIRALDSKIAELIEGSKTVAMAFSQPLPKTFADAEHQRLVADYVAQAPPLDKHALCNTVWNAGLEGLRDLVAEGRRLSDAWGKAGGKVVESVWERNFTTARSHIAAHGKSFFRFLNGDYRKAMAEVKGSLAGELPKSYEERVALVDNIISGQSALRKIHEFDSMAQAAFGGVWRKEKTDWNQLETILNWVTRQNEAGLGPSFRKMFAEVNEQADVNASRLVADLTARLTAAQEEANRVSSDLTLDCPAAFGAKELSQVPLETLRARCAEWMKAPEELSRWNGYFVRARTARQSGLAPLVELMENGTLPTEAAVDGFDRVYFSQLFREMVRHCPQLARFDGDLHNRHVAEFKELDCERIALAKYRTLAAHFDRMPPFNVGIGAAGIVKAEMERKRGHRTVRRLLKDAGSVVQAIKPVFMMSPLSVAQFLEPGAVEFDLLVIDEASQVQPVDALGAMARVRQIVVVGDSKQLPPTRFFARMTSSDESEDMDEDQPLAAQAHEIESILGLCRARGLPEKMLRWHYRSRHHSLIAVSNHEFYENKLYIVPSPFSVTAGLGLKFNFIAEGVFDSGGSGTNRIEAKAIGRAVIQHARINSKLTLGVAAFSVRQQQAILDELELLRRENPDTETFFAAHEAEPFFVKNLENVQGDERDVIFISVGYGKDVNGAMAMRFGPLSNEGGERRLNVLISRAKKRCEVFSSITADDIDLNRATGRGVAAFKAFLSFAQTGRLMLSQQAEDNEKLHFEEAIRQGVESLGFEVHSQVGVAGFFIDLAVVDREQNGRYLLGIECDGASYCAAHSARDRDRLRQSVLEQHGWIMHRVWSVDWIQRPVEQLGKIKEAIDRAKSALAEAREEIQPTTLPPLTENEDGIERESVCSLKNEGLASLSLPYQEARFEVPAQKEPHQMKTEELAGIVSRIVELEGPIHEDEITNRVRALWGFGRAGARIQDAVAKAIRAVLVTQRCTREEGFLSVRDAVVPIRNRENVTSPTLRKPDMLPPAELKTMILAVIDAGHGATKKELPAAVARMLGFKTTSGQLRAVIEKQCQALLERKVIVEAEGMVRRIAAS